MAILYPNEHVACINYAKSDEAIFDRKCFKKGETFEREIEDAIIIFILQGDMTLIDENRTIVVKHKDIILVPPVHRMAVNILEDIELIILRIKAPIHLCNIIPLERLLGETTGSTDLSVGLEANERIMDYLILLSKCLDDGLRCKCFAEIKSSEIFYYFRAYYNKESLKVFFAPLFTKDYEFSVFVLRNYRKMKTVQQFASEMGYSLSRFERQFKKIFKESAYQWMTKQKAKSIYNDLVNTKRTIIDVSDEYGFSSLSQFCDYCKRVLGSSPAKIRTKGICANSFTGFMNK